MNRNNENYTFLFVTLGLLTAFGPFVTDFYLPALPALADYFRSSASMAQMSLTTGMFGLAVGQVFIGPISDRYGRRMPLLVSMAAFIVATALCIVAPNIYLFNLLRLFQGFTAAGGIVLARSIATDMYTGNELTRFIAMISAVNGVAPVVAPVVGGMLLDFTSWKGTFVLLLLVGAALAVLCSQVRESLPVARRSARGVLSAFAANGKVLCEVCRAANARTYQVEEAAELRAEWFEGAESVGICGATSTPRWLMQRVADAIVAGRFGTGRT